MSILVACQCGKKFKAGEQFAGKRVKCPGCGHGLTIPGAAPAAAAAAAPTMAKVNKPAPAARPAMAAAPQQRARPVAARPPAEPADDLLSLAEPEEVFQPASHADAPATVTKPKKAGKSSLAAAGAVPVGKRGRDTGPVNTPKISVSPGIIVLILLAILIPSTITWVKLGPMKAAEQWKEISSKAEDNVPGQILRAVMQHEKDAGMDLMDVKFLPKVTNFQFDESKGIMMIKLPDSVPFQGRTTEGNFKGTFHPKTWKFEASVEIHDTTHQVNGSADENDNSLELDGKAIK